MGYDEDSGELHSVSTRLDRLECEKLRNNMRVFGVADNDRETEEETKDKYVREVFGVAFPGRSIGENDLQQIRRVGRYQSNKNRMILVTFKNNSDKFELFNKRDVLRQKGIRVSNDLAQWQRAKLKELNDRGMRGYYKNGTLYYERRNDINNRVYMHANRRGPSYENREPPNYSHSDMQSNRSVVD
jgi:hypothetical protein